MSLTARLPIGSRPSRMGATRIFFRIIALDTGLNSRLAQPGVNSRKTFRTREVDFIAFAIIQSQCGTLKRMGDLMRDLLRNGLSGIDEQYRSTEGIQAFQFPLPVKGLYCLPLQSSRKLTGGESRNQKRKECNPIFGIGHRQRAYGRQEEIIEAQHCDNGGYGRFRKAPCRSNHENCHEIEEPGARGVDADQTSKYKCDPADQNQRKYKTKRQAPGLWQKTPRGGVTVRSHRSSHRLTLSIQPARIPLSGSVLFLSQAASRGIKAGSEDKEPSVYLCLAARKSRIKIITGIIARPT